MTEVCSVTTIVPVPILPAASLADTRSVLVLFCVRYTRSEKSVPIGVVLTVPLDHPLTEIDVAHQVA